jgi:peptide chain release factor
MNLPSGILAMVEAAGLRPQDVDERFVRGSGPGGQKINKVSSTVWLRHRPTGIEVRCQRERSQWDNRVSAWSELCTRFVERKRAAAAAERSEKEAHRRRTRQKSRGQKVRMIESKKHRARNKAGRGQVEW